MRNNSGLNLVSASFAHPTETKIWNFRKFGAGWHYGEGVEFSENDLLSAINLHSEIIGAGFLKTNAFPGLDGEIRVTVYCGDVYAEFTLEKHGKWTFVLEEGDEEKEYREFLAFNEVVSVVKELPEICVTYECFHVTTGTLLKNDFKVWHSNRPPQTKGFPFSRESAPSAIMGAFADTSENFIFRSPGNLRYFGSSLAARFHPMPNWFKVQMPGDARTNATVTSQG